MANMISSFLHPEDAYSAAERAAQQGWNEAKGFETPYWQHGLDQYGRLNEAAGNLFDPGKLENQWASSYETSPYAKRMLEMNNQYGQEAAASMGLGGSSAAINNIQQGAADIMQKDRQQYMNDLMQKYMQAIGLGKSLYGTGANMGAQLGNQAMNQGQNMAGLEYGREAAPGTLFGNLVKTAAGGIAGGMNAYQNLPGYLQ